MWTSSHPLYGAQLRFERADRHLSEADRLLDGFSDACIDRVVSENDYQAIRMEGGFPPVPIELPVVVSDAIHNMRAALDYIIYELAILDSGKVNNGTQFLIEDIKSDPANPKRGFDGRYKQYLAGLNQSHIDAIEGMQPYRGIEWTKTLRDISNPDKHRTLIAIDHKGRGLDVTVKYAANGRFRGPDKVTSKGLTHDRYDLKFHGREAVAIAGTKSGEPSLMKTLRRLETEVCGVIELFKPEF